MFQPIRAEYYLVDPGQDVCEEGGSFDGDLQSLESVELCIVEDVVDSLQLGHGDVVLQGQGLECI